MKANEIPDFDWVKARHDASLGCFMEALKVQAEKNVATCNARRGDSPIRFEAAAPDRFKVWNPEALSATFFQAWDGIQITYSSFGERKTEPVKVVPRVSEDGLIRVEYQGKELLAWQLLEAVLGRVLFPETR